MSILVFIINLETLYCHNSNDATLALENGTETAQSWETDGGITDLHKASPHETWLKEPCSQFYYIFILFLKVIFEIIVYVVANTQRSGKICT